MTDTHPMHHVATHPDADEYACPVCHRRILLSWRPYHREVLATGDPDAVHVGGKGGASAMGVRAAEAGELPPAEPQAPPGWWPDE